MYLIKRYSNRKLYDTVRKRYLTLAEVGELVAQGYEIQIIDNETGNDLTALTLSQIIYEHEKKHNGFVPKNLLTTLIQKGNDILNRLPYSLHNFLNPMDATLEDLLDQWVEDGILEKKHLERVKEDLLFYYGREKFLSLLEEVFEEYDFPSPKELEKLRRLICEWEEEQYEKG
ncbi:MAG: hypothetical protein D6785_05460 [Planctomycetota bacterium]|nr:MAG: hypothetical protein D6785_05460 [Planctomycetota bacterium]